MKTILNFTAFSFVSMLATLAQANCINITGKYRVSGHPTAVIEYRQIGCDVIYTRESENGKDYTPEKELTMDRKFHKLVTGSIHRGWFEGRQIVREYLYFDKKVGDYTEFIEHWNEFDANGDLLGWERMYDLNGKFLRSWEIRFTPIKD